MFIEFYCSGGTVSGADSLASCREIQGFLHRHFPDVHVVLANVRSSFLRHELVESVPIVSDFSECLEEIHQPKQQGSHRDYLL